MRVARAEPNEHAWIAQLFPAAVTDKPLAWSQTFIAFRETPDSSRPEEQQDITGYIRVTRLSASDSILGIVHVLQIRSLRGAIAAQVKLDLLRAAINWLKSEGCSYVIYEPARLDRSCERRLLEQFYVSPGSAIIHLDQVPSPA